MTLPERNDFSAGAKLAAHAQRCERDGVAGFYVRRRSTQIVVRGPYNREEDALTQRFSFEDEPHHFEVVKR